MIRLNHLLYWIEVKQILSPKARLFFTGLECVCVWVCVCVRADHVHTTFQNMSCALKRKTKQSVIMIIYLWTDAL